MIPSRNPWQSYQQIATQTAPPGHLVLMLFDAALSSLECALPAFDYTDPGQKNSVVHNNLQRAVDIIGELNNALNLEVGGELAATLRNLYFYFEERLLESNRRKRRDETLEVFSHLKVLRDAWAAMLAGQGQNPDSPQPTARLNLNAA